MFQILTILVMNTMFESKEYALENVDQALDIAHLSLQKVDRAFYELGNRIKPLHDQTCVNFFLNNHALPLNQDHQLQQQLLEAFHADTWNKWDHAIFNHPELQHLVFALYSQGKIANPEFETLIRRFYIQPLISKHVTRVGIPAKIQISAHQLLDDHGNFTYEARKLILPTARTMGGCSFQGARLKNFQYLAQAFITLYPRENVFFQVKSDQLARDQLLTQLFHLHAINTPDYLFESHLVFSCLIEDAFQLSDSNITNMVHGRLLAGNLKKSTIERCDPWQIRPLAALGFGLPETSNVHEFEPYDLTRFSIMAHDLYHSRNRTAQGKAAGKIWCYLKDLTRIPLKLCTNLKSHHFPLFSSLTWHFTDAEFRMFPGLTLEESICKTIAKDEETGRWSFFFKQDQVTDFGMQVFMDMAIHADRWKNILHFNPEKIIEKYKNYYEIALKIKPFLEENLQYNLIIFKAFLAFGETHFPIIEKYIADNYLRMQDSFEFIRNNKTQFLGLINKKLGQLDEHALAFIVLQSFKDPVNITQEIDKNTYKKFLTEDGQFIKNIVLMHLYFGKNPAIKKALAELRTNVLNMTMQYPNMLETVMFPVHLFLMQHKTLPDDQRNVIGEVLKYCLLLEQKMPSPTTSLTR